MLSTHLTSIIAQQHVAELHRAAADHRLAHATREARRPDTDITRTIVRRLRRHLTDAQPVSR
jgi:hypothetical protein